MEEIFWFNSWEVNRNSPGFRRQDIHPYAVKYLTPFLLEGKTVFVPLCGKSLDLLYFSHFAFRVVGVETSETIVLQFFEETGRTYKRVGNRFVSGNITLFCCDVFALAPESLGQIDIVYDRASGATLPRFLQKRYRHALERLTPVGAMNFLLDQAPNEIDRHFQNYVIDHIENPAPFRTDPTHLHSCVAEHAFLMHKLYDKPSFAYTGELTKTVR